MPIYEMTAPNGKTYEIEGPEGATDEQIRMEILRQYPEAEGGVHLRTGVVKPDVNPEAMNSIEQWLGVASGSLAPYATAAGLGAVAGAPLAGIGAVPGAAAGVLSLGLSDLATGAYNLASPLLGTDQAQLPSEILRRAYRNVGIGKEPLTAAQRVVGTGLEALAGGVAAPSALATTASRMAPSLTRRVLQTMAEAPAQQAAAAVGGAVAPTIAKEAGVTNPAALTALGLAGGVAAGRAATPKPTTMTTEQLTSKANAAYETAKNSGVLFNENSVADFAKSVRDDLTQMSDIQFNPRLHPRIAVALEEIDALAGTGQPATFSQMEMARRVANTARRSTDPDERRIGNMIIDKLDEFVSNPPQKGLMVGDAPAAAAAATEARTAWRQKRQAEDIQDLVERAKNTDAGLTSKSLRSQFRTVVNNPNRIRKFDPDVQKAMRDFVKGKGGVATLQTLGNLAPDLNPLGIVKGGGLAGLTAAGAINPVAALGIAGTGLAAKAAANRAAQSQVENIANVAKGGVASKQVPLSATLTAAQRAFLEASKSRP